MKKKNNDLKVFGYFLLFCFIVIIVVGVKEDPPPAYCSKYTQSELKQKRDEANEVLEEAEMIAKRSKILFKQGLITQSKYNEISSLRSSLRDDYLYYASCIEYD